MPVADSQDRGPRWFLTYHLPAIVYAGAIVLMSSIPDLKAPELRFLFVDKLAHLVEYAIFALLIFRSFSRVSRRITRRRAFFLSALFLSLFAFLDELYQHFIPGRNSDVYDLAGDILGALVVLAYLWIRPVRAKKRVSQT